MLDHFLRLDVNSRLLTNHTTVPDFLLGIKVVEVILCLSCGEGSVTSDTPVGFRRDVFSWTVGEVLDKAYPVSERGLAG